MLKMLAVEIFLTVGPPSFSSSSIGSSPSRLVIRPTWNSEVFDTWRRMFIRILCFTPCVKRWWIPSLCFTFRWSPAFVANTSSLKIWRSQHFKFVISIFTQDLVDGLAGSIQENNTLLQLLLKQKNMNADFLEEISNKEWIKNLEQREVGEGVRGDIWLAPSPRWVHIFLELHPPFFKRIWSFGFGVFSLTESRPSVTWTFLATYLLLQWAVHSVGQIGLWVFFWKTPNKKCLR